jgi:hypothetical protein
MIASMDEDELVARYGLHPAGPALGEIRKLLDDVGGVGLDADALAIKLLCVQLFNNGSVDDVLRIWRAKESGWDAHALIDVQLLCGAGLQATKQYLAAVADDEGPAALEYISRCEAAGDFDGFSPAEHSAWYGNYYGTTPGGGT